MRIIYFIFLILTTVILWLLLLFGIGFAAGKEANSIYSIIAIPSLLIPVWLYKTKKTLHSLSTVLFFCALGFVLLMPITYISFLNAAYNSAPGSEGLGAAIAIPILMALFLIYIAGGGLITLLLGVIARLIDKKRTK